MAQALHYCCCTCAVASEFSYGATLCHVRISEVSSGTAGGHRFIKERKTVTYLRMLSMQRGQLVCALQAEGFGAESCESCTSSGFMTRSLYSS